MIDHDAISEVAVIGVPHEKWGETPLAVVVLAEGASETPVNLTGWVNARVGKQQRIAGIVLIAELPRNPNGKILKRELRKRYVDALGQVQKEGADMIQTDNASYGALKRVCGLLPLAAILVTACGTEEPAEPAEIVTYNVDSSRISVSGLSSGAMMATQLHVAHSSLFNGVALLSGGPWYCAQGSMKRGLGPCMQGDDIDTAQLIAFVKQAEADGAVDSLANLADDNAWIFHATLDEAVAEPVSQAALAFYAEFMPRESVKYVGDVEAAHGFPTLETGVTCNEMASPYLNACNYDAAGKLLEALYGELEPGGAAAGELKDVSQPGADDATMLDRAFLYVPESCAAGEACGLHVALHGCLQSAEYVGDAFAVGTGYNEWAEANRLLVLYPQVASSKIAPLNPMGCWDWWGYTEDSYATKAGPQVKVIKATMDALAGRMLP